MNTDIECIIIGAGVIGLAIARELSASGREVLIIERHGQAGSETSSRNSEVIHAGIYYPPGSAKARLCVKGKELLYRFVADNAVAHRKAGKLIVATSTAQIATLQEIKKRAEKSGVDDLSHLTPDDVAGIEPELSCKAALLSPSTGLIDAHEYMNALQGHAQENNATFAFNTSVNSITKREGGGYILSFGEMAAKSEAQSDKITCRFLIIAAGLHSTQLMTTLTQREDDNPYIPPKTYYAKGNYFSLSGKSPFERLIYPVPESGGLGVHLTLDLSNRARFGPDVQWLEGNDSTSLDYTVDPARSQSFYSAIRTYWPGLPNDSLQPDYCGIRPKVTVQGQPAGDFQIHDERRHGYSGLVALYGIESPGLTASLAIAELIHDLHYK